MTPAGWASATTACPYCGGTGRVSMHFAGTVASIGPMVFARLPLQQATAQQLCLDLRPPPLPQEPLQAGEIVGYRMWRIERDHARPEIAARWRLKSVAQDYFWRPGEPMTDRCRSNEEIDDTNTVGVWAYKDPNDLIHAYPHAQFCGNYVYGSVWMWGTVIEHKLGYRAQYATVRSLDFLSMVTEPSGMLRSIRDFVLGNDANASDELLSDLRQRYGVGSDRDADKFFPLVQETDAETPRQKEGERSTLAKEESRSRRYL